MKTKGNWFVVTIGLIALFLGLVFLGYFSTQSSVHTIYLGYGLAFGAYGLILWQGIPTLPLRYWLVLAVLARILMVFAFPSLSDDVYRFVWDGRLWLAGQNPFDHLPSWYAEREFPIPGLNAALYQQLNSPEYFTIYPPLAQASFVLASWLSPNSIYGAAVVMKLILLVAEGGSIILLLKLLRQWHLPLQGVLIYALNPLIIVELTGNLHFEALMIFFLLLGFYLLLHDRWAWAALAIAASITSKLLPLMFMPFLIGRLGWKKSLGFFSLLGLVLVAFWLPLINISFFNNFGESLQLYFRQFEFNASIYYLVRELGYYLKGYNLIHFIGPRLAVVVLILIVGRSLWESNPPWRTLAAQCLFAITVYLLFATTIHPWYIALPLLLCLFTPWRWPVLWTALIPLTYINYSYSEYQENLWVVAIEYILVAAYALWEYFRPNSLMTVEAHRPSTDN